MEFKQDENYYTDDFDEEMFEFLESKNLGWGSKEYWRSNHKYLCKYAWNTEFNTSETLPSAPCTKPTKEQFKEFIEMPKKQFTKDNLRTGHLVQLRNGKDYVVYLDADHSYETRTKNYENVLVSLDGQDWINLDDYEEDTFDILTTSEDGYDIVKIFRLYHPKGFNSNFRHDAKELLWERKEKSENQLKIEEIKESIKQLENQVKELEQLEE